MELLCLVLRVALERARQSLSLSLALSSRIHAILCSFAGPKPIHPQIVSQEVLEWWICWGTYEPCVLFLEALHSHSFFVLKTNGTEEPRPPNCPDLPLAKTLFVVSCPVTQGIHTWDCDFHLPFDLQLIPLPMAITGRKDGWGLSVNLRFAPVLASWKGKFLHSLPGDPVFER